MRDSLAEAQAPPVIKDGKLEIVLAANINIPVGQKKKLAAFITKKLAKKALQLQLININGNIEVPAEAIEVKINSIHFIVDLSYFPSADYKTVRIINNPISSLATILDAKIKQEWKARRAKGVFAVTEEQMQRTQTIRKIGPFTVSLTPHEKKLRKVYWADMQVALNQALDPERFNFSKVKEEEVLVDGVILGGKVWRIIINASPVEQYASVVVPVETASQFLYEEDIAALLDLLGLSSGTVFYHSLWAGASVNSKHYQLYLSNQYLFDYIKAAQLNWHTFGNIAIADLTDYPGNMFVIKGDDKQQLQVAFWAAINYLQKNNIPFTIAAKDNLVVITPTAKEALETFEGFDWRWGAPETARRLLLS